MKRFFGIVLMFVLTYALFIPKMLYDSVDTDKKDFNNKLLAAAVDYAGEAALSSCFEENLGMEYDDIMNVVLTPERALDTFTATLCTSYGIMPTTEAKQKISASIATMLLATNDGYYIAEQRDINDQKEFEIVWSPKKAYCFEVSGTAYVASIYGNVIGSISGTGNTFKTLSSFPSDIYERINLMFNRDIGAALDRYFKRFNQENTFSFYLPVSDTGITGVNRIEKPSLIILLNNLSIGGSEPSDYVSINGASAEARKYVVGWTDAYGTKYYSYNPPYNVYANGVVFRNRAEAARAGYYPYINP